MKNLKKLLCTTAIFTCLATAPAFAAESRAEYKEEVAPIQQELKTVYEEIKAIRAENKEISSKYKAIRLEKKETGTLSIENEDWKKAKELYGKIKDIRDDKDSVNVKDLRAAAKVSLQNKDFDAALESMTQALDAKKATLESLREINAVWDEISEYLD